MNETIFHVDGNKLIIERTFSASKELVWDAWENPEVFCKWWGPHGWTTRVKESEFKAGGNRLYGMRCEDVNQVDWYGKESWGKMSFQTVTPKDAFTYTDYFTDEQGNVTEGMPVVRTENTLETVDGGTKFTSTGYYNSEEDLKTVIDMGMEAGIKQTWDRLESLIGE